MKLIFLLFKRKKHRSVKEHVIWKRAKKKILASLLIMLFLTLGIFIYLAQDFYQNQSKLITSYVFNEPALNKDGKITLDFSEEVFKPSIDIETSPEIKFSKKWLNPKKLEITVAEYPLAETKYHFSVKKPRTWALIKGNGINFSLNSFQFPRLVNFSPTQGSDKVPTNENLQIELDQPLTSEYRLDLKINPLIELDYSINENGKIITFKPKSELAEKTDYHISLNLSHNFLANSARQIYNGNFITRSPLTIYAFDKTGNPTKTEEKIEQIQPQILEGKYIDVDISSQTLTLFENGKEIAAYKISTGIRGMDTPLGEFKILGKRTRPWSAKYHLFMPWFIQFTTSGHGIHELPEWPGGYKEGAAHLGRPVSHGCVRLGVGPAKIVYDFAEVGIPIVVHR